MSDKIDVRVQLATASMSVRQWMAVAVCVLINVVDGFEILAAGYTAPAISEELMLSTRLTGMFLSAGPFGMIIGAFMLSPLADAKGRRFVVLLCLALCAVGMATASMTVSLSVLVAARILAGVGVGGMMVAVNTVVAEVANQRRSDFALALQATGFPLGGALAGLLANVLPFDGWRAVYVTGSLLALGLVPLAILLLPESIAFLIERRPRNALQRLQRLTARFNLDSVDALPAAARQEKVPVRQLVRSGSLMIAGSFFLMMLSFYFLSSWAPKLLAASGSATVALSGAALVSAGGVVGDLAFAGLATRWKANVIGPVFACAAFLSALLLTASSSDAGLVPVAALLLGFFLYGAMASHFVIVPAFFAANIRATGSGVAIGTGRIGAAVGPLLGGVILSKGMPLLLSTAIMSMPLMLCAFLLRTAGKHSSNR